VLEELTGVRAGRTLWHIDDAPELRWENAGDRLPGVKILGLVGSLASRSSRRKTSTR
jgi:hypothetical protein